ncbi:MAG: SH3 domain-containing protein [Firmicutes bacterium]|nr:SH3 domain-containing protein [Bacillota bacterium]
MRKPKSSKKYMLSGILILVFLIYPAWGEASAIGDVGTTAVNPNAIFEEANKAYQSGDFLKAVETYQQLCDEGYLSGNLYYNLGNAYYKLGAKGLAVLNYERARRLIPGDADLKTNLNYVLSGVQEGVADWKYEFLKFLTAMAPVEQILIYASILFFGLMVLIILGIIKPACLRNLSEGETHKWWAGIVICWAIMFGLVSSLGMVTFWDQAREQAVAIRAGEVRFEPSEAATLYYNLAEGSRVLILEEKEAWLKVKRVDGKRGWVAKDCLEMI